MIRKFLFPILKNFRLKLFFISLLGLFWSLRSLLAPYLLKNLIDKSGFLSHQELEQYLFYSLLLIGGTWILMELSMRIQGALLAKFLPAIRTRVAEKLLSRLKNHPYPFFLKELTGSLASKMQGVSEGIETLFSIGILSFIAIFSHLIFTLALLASVELSFSFLFLIWFILHMMLTLKMGKKAIEKTGELAASRSLLSGKIIDTLSNIFAVKTFCREGFEKKYLGKFLKKERKTSEKTQKYLENIRLVLGGSTIGMVCVCLAFTYMMWNQEILSLGEITFIVILLLNLTSFLWYLSMELIRFSEELGKVKKHLQSIDFREIKDESVGSPSISATNIEIRNLSYSYDIPLFSNLNFSLLPGEKVALTGLSGSGKTTFLNLLLAHLKLQKGEIQLGGENISSLSEETLRKYFAIAPQNPTLFHRSIKENIQYGNLDAKEDAIIEAAKTAHCHEFITNLPNGYDTIVGEQGGKLSGGQKQRVAIARALLKKSPIIILDEPTASLDNAAAKTMIKNILTCFKDSTLIVITHSKQIAGMMDKKFSMEKG